ncbi:uncharacterized protein K02A2.6-like [Diabrotica virgifera virgifera]|uniref:RNA-directed DNA polymerase n=1 Tax=Diabrotica virgifera virgifera TaxID=50390 RepID=A0ABM5JYA9_DIAVI|nr:uncharacterized protein K02A2.6-like [Diabrotica virgifera virgifera]
MDGQIGHINERDDLIESIKNKYKLLFDGNMCSPIKHFEVKFNIKDNVIPIFKKAYSMPYAIKPLVERKLDQMVQVGILKPVKHSEWASPIVVVAKKNTEDIRICTDFQVTVNKVLSVEQYPLPLPEDIFASLAGGKIFCCIDLSGAYQQLKVNEAFQKYLTINTHIGLFRFTRLTYGIASAPAIFQSIMDQILAGIPNVHCYLDDILISGTSIEHVSRLLEIVFNRLSSYNIKVNAQKCSFFKDQVEYLGHRIDKDGIHPTSDKLRAIKEAPEPKDITQLRSYLGLINYYSKFIPMLSGRLKPLYKLLEKNVKFNFNAECKAAFCLSKELIEANQVLAHYDPNKQIVVACDASSYGVGGVLSHRYSDGREKPIHFVSGTLSKAEQNYSQIEREALAIIFCIKKFHKYLYGRQFILVSDHKPLKVIFNPDRNISVMSASRIIRWNVILSAYDYKVEYRKGSQMYEADMLSRLPLSDPTEVDGYINSFNLTEELPLTFEDVAKVTKTDTVLVKVLDFVKTGWPSKITDPVMKPYFLKRHEMSVEENCLLVGSKVIVPTVLRNKILELIHENHTGMVRSKMLARSIVWWPGLQHDIEQMISSCEICQLSQNNSEKSLMPWPRTANVFERVHIDFFFFNNVSYLLLVDSKSKWIDVHVMVRGTNVTNTIEKLKLTFSIMGLPDIIVSDNGPPFNSNCFLKFCEINGIKVVKSPPYHPQSNGTAERHVQTVKVAFKKFLLEKSTLTVEQRLVNFLFTYRNTPCANTGVSPNEYIFKVKPKAVIDLIKPKKGNYCSYNKALDFKQIECFLVGEKVLVGRLGPYITDKWQEGSIIKRVSPVTYLVQVNDRVLYKHVNSIRKFSATTNIEQPSTSLTTNHGLRPAVVQENCNSEIVDPLSHQMTSVKIKETSPDSEGGLQFGSPVKTTDHSIPLETINPTGIELRRSNRVRHQPQRLDL